MTAEYVAVDEPRDDETAAPGRPIGAQLAVIGEKAVDLPADLLLGLGREVGAVYLGAMLLISRWRLWQTDAAQRARLDDASAVAKQAGGKLPLAHEELSIKRQAQRARLTMLVVSVLVIALTAGSIVSLTWGFWQWTGVAGAVGLLWAAHEYKLRALAALAPAPVVIVLLLGVDQWRWWPAATVAGGLALVCEQVGMRWRPPTQERTEKARPGASYKVLWESIRLRLAEDKVTAERGGTRPLVVEGREVGVAFRFTAREKVSREAMAAVARELEAGRNQRVRFVPDPDNSAGWEVLVRWADPLAEFVPCPHDPPRSRTVLELLEVGVDEDGRHVALPFAHQNLLITGMTRSGKSALTAVIVDKLSACVDVEIDYIDTVGAPDLAAASRCFRKMAVNREGDPPDAAVQRALAILHENAQLARERSQALTEALLTARPGDEPPQNHRPTPDAPQRFTVIEEFPTFRVQCPQAVPLVEEIERRGLKAADGLILLTQSATSGNGVGSTVIQAQSTVRIALAMPGAEVQYALGEGRKDQGYRPDLLQPATLDDPRDAGKFVAIAPNLTGPGLMRSFGLRAPEQIRRSWERHPDVDEHPADDLGEAVDAVVVPEPLATLEVLAVDGDVHTETLLGRLPDGWTATGVGKALRPLGLRSTNVTVQGVQAKGYRADQVIRAVQELDGEQ